jgi:hypothetical protein
MSSMTQNETPSPVQGKGHSNKNTDVNSKRFSAVREESEKTNLYKVHKIRGRLLLPCLSKHAMLHEWSDQSPATSEYVNTKL